MSCPCCGQALPPAPDPRQLVAIEYPGLPVAEMFERGWLGDSSTIVDTEDVRRRLFRFFDVDNVADLRAALGLTR